MIKIWNVYHAPIARYGPELKIIQIEFELEIELGPKFFLLLSDVLHKKYLWYKFGRSSVHSSRDRNCYCKLNLNVDVELEINLKLKRHNLFLDYSIHIEMYL